uniref:Uncharacterized protein n=1 Tax=Nelumbo nucifera TaxID=4432 RepID=A0A822Y721_NELNU|nr:TPA_asm: hypothetical protein HUJ06_031262 [Nelumbo nucifera]
MVNRELPSALAAGLQIPGRKRHSHPPPSRRQRDESYFNDDNVSKDDDDSNNDDPCYSGRKPSLWISSSSQRVATRVHPLRTSSKAFIESVLLKHHSLWARIFLLYLCQFHKWIFSSQIQADLRWNDAIRQCGASPQLVEIFPSLLNLPVKRSLRLQPLPSAIICL